MAHKSPQPGVQKTRANVPSLVLGTGRCRTAVHRAWNLRTPKRSVTNFAGVGALGKQPWQAHRSETITQVQTS